MYALLSFISEASGRCGDRVYLKGHGTLEGQQIIRSRRYVPPSDPQTPRQQAARGRFAQAVRAWALLSEAQRQAWEEYGATCPRTAPTWAETNMQNGREAFLTLTLKRLHVQADALLLTGPPAAPFLGDGIAVTAQAVAEVIVWRASAVNALGVVTELLAQPLRGVAGNALGAKYRTQGLAAFAAQSRAVATPAQPGLWACAVRFVCTDTGQAAALVPLPPVWVGTV